MFVNIFSFEIFKGPCYGVVVDDSLDLNAS
jgi:hypothetical protein